MNFSFTPLLVAVSILIYVCILLTLKRAWRPPFRLSKWRTTLGVLLIVLFSVFAFYDTDYFHYLIAFDDIHRGGSTHMEDIYIWIAKFVGNNYNLFRIVVWGGATFIMTRMVKKLRIPAGLYFLLLSCLFLTLFAYARVSLAMTIVFWGLGIVSNAITKHNITKYLIGILIILTAYFFHKSALFGIGVALIASLITKLNRKTVSIFILAYPILLVIVATLLADVLNYSGSESLVDIESAQGYLNHDNKESGIGAIIQKTLMYTPFYLSVFIYLKAIYSGRYNKWVPSMRIFANANFLCVAIATLFAFNLGINTSVFYYRLLYFAFIPCTVFLVYCKLNRISKLTNTTILIGLLGTVYKLLYSCYLASF